jgi:hypothetical protein
MIVKPLIDWLNSNGAPLLANNAAVVLKGVGDNADIYKDPDPPLATVQTALDNFSAGILATADGGRSTFAARDNLRVILVGLLRKLSYYVAGACQGNLENLIKSGFPPQKTVRTPVGPLATPQNPTLDHGPQSGTLAGGVNPVFGASIYTWSLASGIAGSAPIILQTTAAKCPFSGLTPGVQYTLTVNAIGAAGPSGWSNAVALFCD